MPKTKNLKISKRKATHHMQRILSKIVRFVIRNFGGHNAAASIFKVLKEKCCQSKILDLGKLSFKSEGQIKMSSDKQKLKNSLPLDVSYKKCSRKS